jgi:hypothetical protein
MRCFWQRIFLSPAFVRPVRFAPGFERMRLNVIKRD